MEKLRLSLLRGVCQTPAYVAGERGYFADEGLDVELHVEPTAWAVPTQLTSARSQLAVIPWTRAAATEGDEALVVVCGSGVEEAAVVLRKGVALDDVRVVTVPRRGGMKDLTAMALIRSLGWEAAEIRRQPSGDGAIISLFGQGSDAASMVEPYATMLEELGVGSVVRRTGDVWPGAPGCSLTTTRAFLDSAPEVVDAAVRAFVRGARFVREQPEETAEIASRYIGVHPRFVELALARNIPAVDAVRNTEAIDRVLGLMVELGYLNGRPVDFLDLSFLDRAAETVG